MREEILPQVALSLIPGIGPATIRQLISYCGSVDKIFNTSLSRLRAIPGIGPKTAEIIKSTDRFDLAKEQLNIAKMAGVSMHFLTNKSFPFRLKALDDAPIVLYTKGRKAYDNPRTVGIVGTRRASEYGRRVVRRLLTQLKPYQPTIISGLAYGIDISAHRESLKLGLPTVGVLANGLDYVYPEVHSQTAAEMLEQGGLVSELKFGTKPEMFYFPSRNRIIAGLSDVLVIIEARKKGGALITLDFMKKYRKPSMAVPGPIDAATSYGCNQLLKDNKAFTITEGNDIVKLLDWDLEASKSKYKSGPVNSAEKRILEVLEKNSSGVHIDELCWRTQIPINKMGSHLLSLEFSGRIKPIPGKRFLMVTK